MVNISKLSNAQIEELKFSAEELEELKRAREMEITFDDDCPETTPERALLFRRVNPRRTTAKQA